MEISYPTLEEPATPEYVLAVLQDHHRQLYQFDEGADPDLQLTFDSTLADWREAFDLRPWRQLGRAMNELWKVDVSDAEWKAILHPARKKSLKDVCCFIASRALRPRVRPATYLGKPCVPAGVFLSIRSILHDAGADAAWITPSSLLSPYTGKHWMTFLDSISRLAPGALPLAKFARPRFDLESWMTVATMIIAPITFYCSLAIPGAEWLIFLLIAICLFAIPVAWRVGKRSVEVDVEFGELRTFRDLAQAIALHQG